MEEDRTSPLSILRAEPVSAVALAGYQHDTIVRREVVKLRGGTVAIFAFDQGEILVADAPVDMLAHVLEGEAEITALGIPYSVQQGEIILLPAHRPYSIRAVIRFKMLLTAFASPETKANRDT